MQRSLSPLLLDLPKAIQTQRLLLRPAETHDGKIVFNAVRESLDHLSPWLSWATPEYSESAAEHRMRIFHADYVKRTAMHYLIMRDSTLVGMIGLSVFNWTIPSANLGYWCRSSELNNGYVTEAARALTIFSFEILKLRRLVIVCDAENFKSQRVAERSFFNRELEAKGLIHRPNSDELRLCYQYSCYDDTAKKINDLVNFVYE